MKTRKWITLFILLLSAMLAAAQPPAPQPVTDLVIQVSDNLNDIVLNWSRPQYADSFQVYAGDSSDFQVGVMTRIGTTPDTTFIHVNGLMGAQKRFYAVVAIAGPAGMVLVPAGLYDMGATYQSWAQPIHTVNVPAFYMDRYEVTNAQYKAFCDATSRTYPDDPSSGFYTPPYFTNPVYANYPVVMVDWNDARAYAAWAGKRLPSEAEWERAAKGNTDNRQWPWGDTWVDANANILDNPADGYTYTSPVGNYPSGISPTGCFDMAGNVYEWCEDDGHASYNGAPTNGSAWIDNPRGSARVLRGGSWRLNSSGARCAYRGDMDPAGRNSSVGFRCSKSFVNQPPQVPSSPSPADSAIGQSVDVNLSWTCSDPDLDPLTYDVYFGTASTPPLVNSGQTAVTYDPGTLADITAYYWRIVAHDNHDSTSGPVWSFTTEGFAGMVLIPAGLYDMGATYQSWAQPIHTVNVPAFYMDRYEVTNAQYKA
ncbi:MAG: SUMF1/EgtB/PvdO family nonheme iron enzyme, partial [bacterium]|nr:SUMF1/EgtB/PvdO family nonheme iron enzyme [bacterium]